MVPQSSSIKAVVDINVFVSGTSISPQNYPAQVIDMWQNGYFNLVISEPILNKIAEVYKYSKVQEITKMFDSKEINKFIDDIRKNSELITNLPKVNISPDPEDNSLFSCAIGGKADYIVSGDKKHVLLIKNYKGIGIVSPKEFVEEVIVANLTDGIQ